MKKLFVILILLFSFTLLAISQDSLQNKSKRRTFDAKIFAKDKEAVLVIVEKLLDSGHSYITIKRLIWANGEAEGYEFEISGINFSKKE